MIVQNEKRLKKEQKEDQKEKMNATTEMIRMVNKERGKSQKKVKRKEREK